MKTWIEDKHCDPNVLSLLRTVKQGGSLCAYAYDENKRIIWDIDDKPICAEVFFEKQKGSQIKGFDTYVSKMVNFKETESELRNVFGFFIKNHIDGAELPIDFPKPLGRFCIICINAGELVVYTKTNVNFLSTKTKVKCWILRQ